MNDLDIRVTFASEPGCDDCIAEVLRIRAVNRGASEVRLWACAVLTNFGVRMYLEPHLAYPLTVEPGSWCTEWVSCITLARELRARGFEGPTTVTPMFIEDTPRRVVRWAPSSPLSSGRAAA